MKKVSSAFGKFIISAMLVTGLAACNTNQRSQEGSERSEGSEDVRIRQDTDRDTMNTDRDATIRTDEDGYGDTKVQDNTKVDLERDRGDADKSTDRNR